MKMILPYLTFDGNCREAMTFYANAMGAHLNVMSFTDMPDAPNESGDRVMHSNFHIGTAVLMASDTMPGPHAELFEAGNNFSVSIACETSEEVDRLYTALGQGGTPTMPPRDTFWGAYFGMLKDKFGIQWMFNYDLPKPA